jgi:toxin ParE1/3/4
MTQIVRFTKGARNDLRNLHVYISKNDSQKSADYVVREIVRAVLALRDYPNRGAYLPELLRMGNCSYRQISFKPFCIFYRIRTGIPYIAIVADGRRDMASLLARRLHSS